MVKILVKRPIIEKSIKSTQHSSSAQSKNCCKISSIHASHSLHSLNEYTDMYVSGKARQLRDCNTCSHMLRLSNMKLTVALRDMTASQWTALLSLLLGYSTFG